jgi:hypothetical protein
MRDDDSGALLNIANYLAPGLLLASTICFVMAVLQRVYRIEPDLPASIRTVDSDTAIYGTQVVLFGWTRFFGDLPVGNIPVLLHYAGLLGWFANPLIMFSIVHFMKHRRLSKALSLAALALATVSISIIGQTDSFMVLRSSGQDFFLSSGIYYWYVSICLFVAGNYLYSPVAALAATDILTPDVTDVNSNVASGNADLT